MTTVLVLAVLFGIGYVLTLISRARTGHRNTTNSHRRTSLVVTSRMRADDLAALLAARLEQAGATVTGAWDGTTFLRLGAQTQLELQVETTDIGSRARVSLPSVRSHEGRQQRLGRVESVLDGLARSVTTFDATATVQ
jgi:hypothetical protein